MDEFKALASITREEEVHFARDGDTDEACTAWDEASEHNRMWQRGAGCTAITLAGVCLLFISWCMAVPFSNFGYTTAADNQNATANYLTFTDGTVKELLKSEALSEVVGHVAVGLGELAATFHQQTREGGFTLVEPLEQSRVKLAPSEIRRLRTEAQNELKRSLQAFLAENTDASHVLASIQVSAKQVESMLGMLHALADQHILSLGLKASRQCAGSSSARHVERCLQQLAAMERPKLLQLRENLLPHEYQRGLGASLYAQHLAVITKRVFKFSTKLGNWNAEVELGSQSSRRNLLGQTALKVTPVNWFTVGAPVISNMLGLVFLSLMALLPGKGGFLTNRAANYALWGVQGGATLGECLANIGHQRGVVYFSSCMIDVMFLGLEVIWVFFNGRQVSGPRRQTQCNSYSQWPSLQGSCGNCMGLVYGARFEYRCDVFCGSFGHTAKFAACVVSGTCFPQGQYQTFEPIPFNVMLCQCVRPNRQLAELNERSAARTQQHMLSVALPQSHSLRLPSLENFGRQLQQSSNISNVINTTLERFECTPYATWPDILGSTCGNCEAVVQTTPYGGRCDQYCRAIGHECVSAAETMDASCKGRNTTVSCDQSVRNTSSGMLCTCRTATGLQPPPSQCRAFSQWPQINVQTCGDCTAKVAVNIPAVSAATTCEEFCTSFSHRCSAAAAPDLSACSIRRTIGCSDTLENSPEALCTCVEL